MVLKSRYTLAPSDVPDLPLHAALFERLKTFGDGVALIDGVSDVRMSRDQLMTSVRAVASGLSRLGVGKGDIVALYAGNHMEFPVIFLAITAIGATVAPINPFYRKDELLSLLRLIGVQWLYTTTELIGHVQAIQPQYPQLKGIVLVGEGASGCHTYASLLANDGSRFPSNVHIRPREDTAVILFSSGTTGLPKGVMLTHFNIVVNTVQRLYGVFNAPVTGPVSPTLLYLPLFHAYGMATLVSALWRGTPVLILPRFEPRLFLRSIEKYKVTTLNLVPPIVAFLAKSPLVDEYDLTSLRAGHCGAAPLAPDMEPRIKSRLKLDIFNQGYGMTELTTSVSRKPVDVTNKPASIGELLPAAEAKVIDVETGRELGPNTVGEMCFKSPSMMKGYYGDKKATDEMIDSEGWLHTGDLGYYDDDEFLYIVDRIKELIKYKANQIAPAELEGLLSDHPAVADVAVVGMASPNTDEGEIPRAFVVARPGHVISASDLVIFIDERVAAYKRLRGGVTFVSEIPRNASGKILRRVLRDSVAKGPAAAAAMAPGGGVCSGSEKRSKL